MSQISNKKILNLFILGEEYNEFILKENILFSLVCDLCEKGYLKTNYEKINVNIGDVIEIYEVYFLKYIKNKKWLELDDFLENLHFTPSLERLGYIKKETTKKFLLYEKDEKIKTSKFYQVLALLVEDLEECKYNVQDTLVFNDKNLEINKIKYITNEIIKKIKIEKRKNG